MTIRTSTTVKVLTWPDHANYLYYLANALRQPRDGVQVRLYLPTRPDRSGGYCGRDVGLPLPDNVAEVDTEALPDLDLDCVLYQRSWHRLDAEQLLSDRQLRLPRLCVEHDPPCRTPPDETHWTAGDPQLWLYHCTRFNALMWDNGDARVGVIEYGVTVPNPGGATRDEERGVVALNDLPSRGRRVGLDLYRQIEAQVPLHLFGTQAEQLPGGLGPIDGVDLPATMARYRFFFYPIRYTTFGLALIEAMMVGLAPVCLPVTELAAAIEHGRTGYLASDVDDLVGHMRRLLKDPDEAAAVGAAASAMALDRFDLDRFGADWHAAFLRALA